jgi:hypothetical protein
MSDQLGYASDTSLLIQRFEELSALSNHQLLVVEDRGIKGWIHLELVHDMIETKKVELLLMRLREAKATERCC